MRSKKWIKEHFEEFVDKYPGKYLAIVEDKIVAIKESPKEAEDEALRIYPDRIPSVLLVPRKEDLACLL